MIPPKTILIIDDNQFNRTVLYELILSIGHTPILAENGDEGILKIIEHEIDLVLLDIVMPLMDGYDVLTHIKGDEKLRHISVIMITAVDEMESVVRCVEQGADDYLVKPFNPTLLRARINACLEKKHVHDQEQRYQTLIEEYNLRLEEQVRQKTRELVLAHDRLRILDKAKSDFLSLIAHELRTPLTGILGAAEMAFEHELDPDTRQEFKRVFHDSRHKLLTILDEALLITRIETSEEGFPIEPVSISTVLETAMSFTHHFATSRQVVFGQLPSCDYLVPGENRLLTRALSALLRTIIKFSTPGQTIRVTCHPTEHDLSLCISTIGRTIPEEVLPKFFEVFSIAEPITPGGDLGLDPPVAERIIKLFGGTVTVENLASPGICFTVRLLILSSKMIPDALDQLVP